MEQTKDMINTIKIDIINEHVGYDVESMEYAIDQFTAGYGDSLAIRAANYLARASEITRDITQGRIPEFKISAMMDKAQRLRVKSRVLDSIAMELQNYSYNIKEPSADALEGSYTGGIHK